MKGIWSSMQISEKSVDGWLLVLGGENPAEVLAAIRHLTRIRAAKKIKSANPGPEDILEAIKNLRNHGKVESMGALEAWATAGTSKGSPRANLAFKRVFPSGIGGMTQTNIDFLKKDFIAEYDRLSDTELVEESASFILEHNITKQLGIEFDGTNGKPQIRNTKNLLPQSDAGRQPRKTNRG